jgi:hypothetical protein
LAGWLSARCCCWLLLPLPAAVALAPFLGHFATCDLLGRDLVLFQLSTALFMIRTSFGARNKTFLCFLFVCKTFISRAKTSPNHEK